MVTFIGKEMSSCFGCQKRAANDFLDHLWGNVHDKIL